MRLSPSRPSRHARALLAACLTLLVVAAGCANPDPDDGSSHDSSRDGSPQGSGPGHGHHHEHRHPGSVPAPDPDAGARLWLTSPTDPSRRLVRSEPVGGPGPSTVEVTVDPRDRHQRWWGTGAALTDAARRLLADRPGALRLLYGPGSAGGARLNLLRLPLTSTDLSPTTWSWGWDGSRATPPRAERRAVRQVTGAVAGLRPDLRVVATPWTAPPEMKTSGTLRGGALRDDALDDYGRMLLAQAGWLTDHGVPLWAMTLGNEPGYSADYPTMTMTDAQMAALGQGVGPPLRSAGIRLWAVDHNWADRSRVDAVLEAAPDGFDGAAFHCYSGGPGEMAGLGVPRLVTECTGTGDGWPGTFAWDARTLVAGAVDAGSSGLMMWSLALDAGHGPVDAGSAAGCKGCRGLVTVADGRVRAEPEFYTLAHLSRAAAAGARVISSSAGPGLSVAAFLNPDGSVGVFGHNATGAEQTVRVHIDGGPDLTGHVEAGDLFTFRSAPR
jgi:glucosylceramidase